MIRSTTGCDTSVTLTPRATEAAAAPPDASEAAATSTAALSCSSPMETVAVTTIEAALTESEMLVAFTPRAAARASR